MSAAMLMRLGSLVGRDATPLDVDLAAAQLGRDPLARDVLIDLATLGVVRSAWRQGPVEDWHIAGRIGQVEMMRSNAATSRQVRGVLSELLPQRWWTWNARTGLRTDALMLWTVLAREIGSVDRQLPDGHTVAELAPDDTQAVDYRNNVLWCRDRWLALTAHYGLRAALIMLACYGAWLCRRWWLHPDWSRRVNEYIAYLRNPSRHPFPKVAAMIAELQRRGRLINADEVRRALLNGPDLLDADLAADVYVVIASTPVKATPFGAHPTFLNLLEQARELFVPRSMPDVTPDVSP